MYRMLPGFAPPANSHSIPTNPSRSLEFTVNGTSDDQNNTRIDGVSTAHIQLPHVASYIPTLESIEEVNVVTSSMDAEQGLAGGAAINVQTKSGTNVLRGSGFEYFTNQHLKAWPMRFDDAALNTGDKPETSYHQYGGTVGGPIEAEQGVLLRQLRVHARPPGRRQHRVGADAGDAAGRSVAVADADLRSAVRECRTASGRTQFQVLPGRSELRALQHGDEPELPQHHSCGPDGSDRAEDRELLPGQQHRPGAGQLFRVRRRSTFDRQQVDSKVDYNVNSKFNLAGTFGVLHYRTVVPTVFGEDGRRASRSAEAAIPGTATATRTGSRSWAPTSSARRS